MSEVSTPSNRPRLGSFIRPISKNFHMTLRPNTLVQCLSFPQTRARPKVKLSAANWDNGTRVPPDGNTQYYEGTAATEDEQVNGILGEHHVRLAPINIQEQWIHSAVTGVHQNFPKIYLASDQTIGRLSFAPLCQDSRRIKLPPVADFRY